MDLGFEREAVAARTTAIVEDHLQREDDAEAAATLVVDWHGLRARRRRREKREFEQSLATISVQQTAALERRREARMQFNAAMAALPDELITSTLAPGEA